ncbi:hypothetical protein IKG_05608 [Bacillus cereus VD200]|nr:hypothetical protein IKG_05608 [Bacillus cereus VD200]
MRIQRVFSRRTKGSSSWNKQRVKVASIHEYITNARKDLQVANMPKNHKLAKAINEVSQVSRIITANKQMCCESDSFKV